jgi:hypothetical protein
MKAFSNKGWLYSLENGKIVRDYFNNDQITDLENNLLINIQVNSNLHIGSIWTYNDKEAMVRYEAGTFYGNLFDDKSGKYLLILKPQKSTTFPPPNNAIIYNSEGTIHKILTTPLLIGRIAQRYKQAGVLKGASFGGLYPSVYKNSKGKEVIGVAILFPEKYRNPHDVYFEVREINLETGEFGEVLQDGAV